MAGGKPIRFETVGMRETRAALKALGNGMEKGLQRANKAAAERVKTGAIGRAGSSRMGSRARATIRARGSQREAAVVAGKGVPYYHGFEFGSTRYRQFPSVRNEGYHLYPTIKHEGPQIIEDYAAALDELLRQAGFK